MKKLTRSQFIQTSIMLFGLFFGAGNLIFPPLLGNQAGTSTWLALLGFIITAVLFPLLGAISVGKTDGLKNLANKVNPIFSIIFTTAIYLSIGPGLGIPRAGSVPFEMAISPYISENTNINLARLIYTAIFFLVALFVSLKPNKLVKRMGKFMTPVLLFMIFMMFIKIVLMPKQIAEPVLEYANSPITKGFIDGYNTMDAVAGLNFGLVISLAIKGFGIEDKKDITKYTIKSGILAGTILLLVYAALSYIGKMSSVSFAGAENGALILTDSIKLAYGNFGVILLAAIFTLACLTTCIGLITSGSEYFYSLFKEKLSYETWVIIWTGLSFIFANFGLNTLLAYSVPLLTIIYPVSLLLIVMGILDEFVNFPKISYTLSATFSIILPVVDILYTSLNIKIPFLTDIEKSLPLAKNGLGWILPTLVVLLVTSLFSKKKTN